ncbi:MULTISPECIES: class I SAM-dependent methyltransferase family protein [unclassified Methanoregula]|uniref:class I SAM-dependent methyltransferase n=1 Tax=unclassified Methanoregula TaxID=2649730 RepID=UPI0009D45A2C|nr:MULTISPECIES: class I SAM-dependent methyltransferase family protein [unclassified Methanoregula]OPX61801.1 MAG: tRNA (guanine(37)-N1)-methyltransferase Trm5b [Methanoregula sp. PtaB.Bin085]OPY33889.1 MAG: tRNA (guanine(37)-N1)-methyltransferase Trm5b [Methanoregula sp. PtaU1.Bin006]
MTVGQWGIRVPARQGEAMRQALIREGALDTLLKVRREGTDLILPVLAEREGAGRYEFEAHAGRDPLPRHELVGGIAILQEDDPAGAEKILASRPSLHTAVYAQGEVSGEYRTRELKILAGKPTTRTEVTEHGRRYTVDLAGAYFSARLSTERQRILDQVQEGEVILDMFAGVGPFAITLAAKASVIVAADLNPRAVELMLENIRKNRVENVVPVLADARRLAAVLSWKFDRIVMNLPLAGTEFLPDAFRLCRPGGAIHFYALVSTEGEHTARIQELGGTVIAERTVRSYSPGQWHAVYDIIRDQN